MRVFQLRYSDIRFQNFAQFGANLLGFIQELIWSFLDMCWLSEALDETVQWVILKSSSRLQMVLHFSKILATSFN